MKPLSVGHFHAATFLSRVVGAVMSHSLKACHYGSESLQSGRKGRFARKKRFNMRNYIVSTGEDFSVFCLIFFDTLYRIWHVCRMEWEENERMLKVLLLLCGIQMYISACLRSDVSTAPDQNQRPPNHCVAKQHFEHLDQSFVMTWQLGWESFFSLSVFWCNFFQTSVKRHIYIVKYKNFLY